LHEFGHSFGKLADEYDYGSGTYTGPEPSQINVSIYSAQQQTDLQTKWYRWLDLPNVDTYEGAIYCKYGIYRPTYNSKMRSLDWPFEQVNDEQFIFKIYENVSIIDDSTPLSEEPISGYTDFYVVPVEPTPNTIDIQWYIDGQPVSDANAETFSPNISTLTVGLHEVLVTVTDNTSMVRNEIKRAQLMTKSLQWQINVVKPDLNQDNYVDFLDFAIFANYWLGTCSGPDWCKSSDLDQNGVVNFNDLRIFVEYWLEGIW
jgi:hypothetical protein